MLDVLVAKFLAATIVLLGKTPTTKSVPHAKLSSSVWPVFHCDYLASAPDLQIQEVIHLLHLDGHSRVTSTMKSYFHEVRMPYDRHSEYRVEASMHFSSVFAQLLVSCQTLHLRCLSILLGGEPRQYFLVTVEHVALFIKVFHRTW